VYGWTDYRAFAMVGRLGSFYLANGQVNKRKEVRLVFVVARTFISRINNRILNSSWFPLVTCGDVQSVNHSALSNSTHRHGSYLLTSPYLRLVLEKGVEKITAAKQLKKRAATCGMEAALFLVR
jgi:hypothetical protein